MNPRKIGRYSTVAVLSHGTDEDLLTGEQGSRRVTIRLFHGKAREGILEDARRIAALSHPNVAHQEVGLHADAPFLAAETVGESLAHWSAKTHGLPERLVIIEGIATGLAHAHAHGVAHGRLTPERIAVGPDGVPRVWGFGVRGTAPDKSAAYTAPELEGGRPPTALADVYSAGVVFYELLAGETPRGEAPPHLRELRKDMPKDLADAIMACRERSADWRPKDFDYLIAVVRRLRGTQPAARPAAPRRLAVTETPRWARPEKRRFPPPLLPIAIGVVALLGGGAALYLRRGSPPPPAPPATPTPSPTVAATAQPPEPNPMPSPAATTPPAPVAEPSSPPTTLPPSTRPAATPRPKPTPAPAATAPPATAPAPAPATTTPVPQPTSPPVTTVPATPPDAGPALIRAVSPPSLRRGQRTLVDVRGQGLYRGLGAALLKGGRPADGLRVQEQRFVSPSLVQVFIEVDASAPAGAYSLVLSDGTNLTNAMRFEVAK